VRGRGTGTNSERARAPIRAIGQSAAALVVERLVVLSDHYDAGFGKAYGTLIRDLRVECRAAFVVDKTGVIRYAEYVSEVANHPNYDAILACAKKCAG
jgi:thiol peroxidase